MATARKANVEEKLRQWAVSPPTPGDFTTCTVMFSSGVRIFSATTVKET
jgi:hypothetical protein